MSNLRDVSSRMSSLRRRAFGVVLAAGLAGSVLPGCGRDAEEEALSDASITLASLDVGVGTRTPPGVSSKAYNEVIASMQPLASGEGSIAADAAVLLSNAQRGLGIHEAAQAAALEKTAENMLPGIRARLRSWQMHNAAAKAAEAYDPAPELARIDADVRARQEQSEREQAAKREIEAQVADLLQQVTDRLAKASALRDEAGVLELRIPAVSATEGLALSEQIRGLSREADALEFEARDLKNQADRLALDVQGSQVEIDKLTEQIRLLGESRAAVQTRAKAAEEQAARARGDAQKAAVEIAERVDTGENALTPFREQQVAPATQEAVAQFQTAIGSAKRGTGARRSNANIAVGQAQQSLGDAYWTSALGHETYALLMEELATVEPPLPSAPEYAARAEAARNAANEARNAAYAAYQAAKAAYESTGASGEAGELLDQVSARLNEISRAVGKGVVSDEELDTLTAPEGEAEEMPAEPEEPLDDTEADAAAVDPEAELRAAISAALEAQRSGDMDTAAAFLHPATPADAQYVEIMSQAARDSARLDAATAQAFGQPFSEWLKASNDPVLAPLAAAIRATSDLDPASMRFTIEGDEAVGATGNPMVPEVKFRRVDGEWKQLVDVAAQADANPAVAGVLLGAGQVFGELADGVEAGELDSNEAVGEAFMAKLSALMPSGGGG